jgi:hypothetical protein
MAEEENDLVVVDVVVRRREVVMRRDMAWVWWWCEWVAKVVCGRWMDRWMGSRWSSFRRMQQIEPVRGTLPSGRGARATWKGITSAHLPSLPSVNHVTLSQLTPINPFSLSPGAATTTILRRGTICGFVVCPFVCALTNRGIKSGEWRVPPLDVPGSLVMIRMAECQMAVNTTQSQRRPPHATTNGLIVQVY